MANQFNLARYKELLELEKSNKITFLDLELLTYGASIESQICYNRKENYFSLIEKYLIGKIASHEFRSKFLEMEKQDGRTAYIIKQDFQKLEVFTLADDLEEFSDLIGEISTLCLEYDEIWDGTMERMSESEFYSLVNKYYFQLAELFPVVSINNLPYEKLISRSFKNLAGILGLGILLIFCNISNINLIGF
jgi:hypothetical protein